MELRAALEEAEAWVARVKAVGDEHVPDGQLRELMAARLDLNVQVPEYNRPCAHHYVGKSQSCMVVQVPESQALHAKLEDKLKAQVHIHKFMHDCYSST